jgi:hypothetical protein
MKNVVRCAILGSLVGASGVANGVIMRHDVDRSGYVLLGDQHRETVAMLGLLAQQDGAPMLYSGMGTLIAPDWIVTAAHATDYLRESEKDWATHHLVYVKGRGYHIAAIITHPNWNPQTNSNDLALVKLSSPVREAKPACLYDGREEAGQIVTIAGSGYPGDGLKGPSVPDGSLLGATVKVQTAEGTVLTWRFHAPKQPDVTPLEGISGPGDSGGPAFIGTRSCLAGISSVQSYEIDPTKPKVDQPQGRYGANETYTRVSAFVTWIRQTIAAK